MLMLANEGHVPLPTNNKSNFRDTNKNLQNIFIQKLICLLLRSDMVDSQELTGAPSFLLSSVL